MYRYYAQNYAGIIRQGLFQMHWQRICLSVGIVIAQQLQFSPVWAGGFPPKHTRAKTKTEKRIFYL